MQAEALLVGTLRLGEHGVAWRRTLHREHLLPGAWVKGDAVGTSKGFAASSRRSGMGIDGTHWRTGTRGMTWSTRCAAVCDMSRAPQDGQNLEPPL